MLGFLCVGDVAMIVALWPNSFRGKAQDGCWTMLCQLAGVHLDALGNLPKEAVQGNRRAVVCTTTMIAEEGTPA